MMLIDNRNYLRLHDRPLLEKLAKLDSKEHDDRLIVESSKKGVPTVRIMVDGKVQYIHSKYDPEAEAERLIGQIEGLDEYDHILFIGTGLGYHIKKLLVYLPDMSFSIYEPDLEMLYQFFTIQDITAFPKTQFNRIITTENEDEIRLEVENLYKTIGKKILVYTLPSYAKHYNEEEKVIRQVFKELLKNNRNSIVTDAAFQKRWTINSIKNFPKVLETPNILHDIDKEVFTRKPAIIVAAGPSLNEEFENLKYIKEKGLAYIFSVGAAINALIEHEIYPDAACTYDPTQGQQLVIKKIKDNQLSNIPLVFGSSVGFETLENYPGHMLHMITSQDTISPRLLDASEDINIVLDAPSIAVVTFQLLKKLGCSQIILVGQNLAFLNNSRYAEGINFDFVKNELSEQEKNGLLTVKDVYGNDVQTNEDFNRMRQQLEMYINLFPDVEVINTTKGGAQIVGTEFTPLSEVISEKWRNTSSVKPNWFVAENSYDLTYTAKCINNMKLDKSRLEQTIYNAIKELRNINTAVKLNQIKGLEKKFTRFDKEFKKLRYNPFFKAFIEPMVRVHNQRLTEESQAVRFEMDLIKKGRAIAHMFTGFLIDCQEHIQSLAPFLEELEGRIQNLNNQIENQVEK